MIKVGLEILTETDGFQFKGKKLGYLSNQASTSSQFVHGKNLLHAKFGKRLDCLFSPQHGFFSEKQDNMVESAHGVDKQTGLTIYSLYGERRRPSKEMFAQLDVLLIDLIDVGTRVYTFVYTMVYCMELAAELGKKVVILDRPNPIGGDLVEGNLVQPEFFSFVGLYPLPMRHGLTIGEFAKFVNSEYNIQAELEVVPVEGWNRKMLFDQTGYPWLSPSPNMPSAATALVYPGQVLWEGTNVSEGRGTTQPFEFVGAPYWQHEEMEKLIKNTELPGCYLRPIAFEPTFGKWQGQCCNGFQIHVTNPETFMPYRTSLSLLQASIVLYPDHFAYKQPPYEYEYEKLPIDLIIGDQAVRKQLEAGISIIDLEDEWQDDLQIFKDKRKQYLLY